ncbi:hypothetical protein ACZ90_43525 [Streptomyces albus subsp. albus]|nr:hypothetical protein ACZ90_43525 [Streptomyces albus subsp. albus]
MGGAAAPRPGAASPRYPRFALHPPFLVTAVAVFTGSGGFTAQLLGRAPVTLPRDTGDPEHRAPVAA